jgi:hypothetical protein
LPRPQTACPPPIRRGWTSSASHSFMTCLYIVFSGSGGDYRAIYILYPVTSQEARDLYPIVQRRIQTLLPTRTVQFPPGSQSFHIEHDRHLDPTRVAAVRYRLTSCISFPQQTFQGVPGQGFLERGPGVLCWRVKVHHRRYYHLEYPATIEYRPSQMNALRRGRASTCLGWWSIILWPKRTRTYWEIEDVLGSTRNWAIVNNTLPVVALIFILWLFPKPLERSCHQQGKNEGR